MEASQALRDETGEFEVEPRASHENAMCLPCTKCGCQLYNVVQSHDTKTPSSPPGFW
jgi:hypothetical protein